MVDRQGDEVIAQLALKVAELIIGLHASVVVQKSSATWVGRVGLMHIVIMILDALQHWPRRVASEPASRPRRGESGRTLMSGQKGGQPNVKMVKEMDVIEFFFLEW